MARIVSGPEITGQVTNMTTGAPYGGVTVNVTPQVYTDPEMTIAVSSLTANGQGLFSCYATPGNYTFTTAAVGAGPIEPVEVLGVEQGVGTHGGGAGVVSFNTRTGAVTLSKADVTGTGLASADVNAAAAVHTHAEADTTNLVSDLAAKASTANLTAHTSNTSNPHSTTAAQVSAPNYVNHGATAGTARPAGATVVLWAGSVNPTNATSGDLLVDTTNLVLKRFNGATWDPLAPVVSFNSRTGAITLTKADVTGTGLAAADVGALAAANNLSDLANTTTARTNLGVSRKRPLADIRDYTGADPGAQILNAVQDSWNNLSTIGGVYIPAGVYTVTTAIDLRTLTVPAGLSGLIQSWEFVMDEGAVLDDHTTGTGNAASFMNFTPPGTAQIISSNIRLAHLKGHDATTNHAGVIFSAINNSRIHISLVEHFNTDGVRVDCAGNGTFGGTTASQGTFNNDWWIGEIGQSGSSGLSIIGRSGGSAFGFQGNTVRTGDIIGNTASGVVVDGSATGLNSIYNTFILGPVEHNGSGVIDGNGLNIWIINNTNTNTTASSGYVLNGSAQGVPYVRGYFVDGYTLNSQPADIQNLNLTKPRNAFVRYTTAPGGIVSINSTSWTGVTALSGTIQAAVGDLIEVGVNFSTGSDTTPGASFDVASIVSSSPVNYVSTGSGTPASFGVIGWQVQSGTTIGFLGVTGSTVYKVQAGDLSSGQLTMRLFFLAGSAATPQRNINASATIPAIFYVKNLGASA